METFLVLNGFEIRANTDEQERLMLALAGGEVDRPRILHWLREHVRPRLV